MRSEYTDRIARGGQYRFPIAELSPYPNSPNLHSVVILLKDEIGYWEPPAEGDLYIYLTWRGLASNWVKLGYGPWADCPISPVPNRRRCR